MKIIIFYAVNLLLTLSILLSSMFLHYIPVAKVYIFTAVNLLEFMITLLFIDFIRCRKATAGNAAAEIIGFGAGGITILFTTGFSILLLTNKSFYIDEFIPLVFILPVITGALSLRNKLPKSESDNKTQVHDDRSQIKDGPFDYEPKFWNGASASGWAHKKQWSYYADKEIRRNKIKNSSESKNKKNRKK